jgi:hypothetical protein
MLPTLMVTLVTLPLANVQKANQRWSLWAHFLIPIVNAQKASTDYEEADAVRSGVGEH